MNRAKNQKLENLKVQPILVIPYIKLAIQQTEAQTAQVAWIKHSYCVRYSREKNLIKLKSM